MIRPPFRARWFHRQRDNKRCSHSDPAFNRRFAAVRLDDFFRNRQA
jgi:hypothetical protein